MILSAVDFSGKTVVDVGSGDGTYTAEIAKRSAVKSVLGVEPAPKATQCAAETHSALRPRVTFECCDSEALLRRGQHFDIAVYRGVIHHVPDPKAEIERAVRLADTLIVLEPNGWNLMMKLVEKLSPYHREHGEQSYLPSTLAAWARQAGSARQHVRYFGLVPYFCPSLVAKFGHLLEPAVERVPLARRLVCGQYLMVAGGKSAARSAELGAD